MSRLFRKGDRVSIMGMVEHRQEEGEHVCVKVDGHYGSIFLAPEIVTLVCPHIAPGETVQHNVSGRKGIVQATYKTMLWVERDGECVTWDATEVTLINPTTTPQLEAAE